EATRKVLDKARRIAAHKLQRRPDDLTYENGVFVPVPHPGVMAAAAHVTKKAEDAGVHRVFRRRTGLDLPAMERDGTRVTVAEAAREAHLGHDLPRGMTPGLDETQVFDPVDLAFAYGTHIAVVEVDVETGQIAVLRHVVVDDCGRIINPLLVEGQVHGGAAQ